MNIKVRIGDFLKEARLKKGLSQGNVRDKLDLGTSQEVSNWERNVTSPTTKTLKRLSRVYSLPKSDIIDQVVNNIDDQLHKEFFR